MDVEYSDKTKKKLVNDTGTYRYFQDNIQIQFVFVIF